MLNGDYEKHIQFKESKIESPSVLRIKKDAKKMRINGYNRISINVYFFITILDHM